MVCCHSNISMPSTLAGYDDHWDWLNPKGDVIKRTPSSPPGEVKTYWETGIIPYLGQVRADVSYNGLSAYKHNDVGVMPNSGTKPW